MRKPPRPHGDGGLWQRPDGRWEASITLPSAPGRQRRRRAVRKTQREALEALKELRRERDEGAKPGRLTVSAHLDDWISREEQSEKDPKTVSQYRWARDHYFAPAFGHVLLKELERSHVDRMLAAMKRAGKSKQTMVRVRAILVMALDDALGDRQVTWNAARGAKVPKPSEAAQERARSKEQRRREYRPEHETALVEAARGDRLEALWLVMLWAGLRPGEATGLTWDRVDLDAGRLTVDRARVDTPDGMVLAAPKGGEDGPSVRVVEIPGPLVAALKAHQARQREEIMRHRDIWTDTAGLVFTSQLGTMIDRGNLRRGFSALAERAGLGADWHPHEARHLYVSQCVDAGLTMTEVADAVGHARGSRTTARVYSHRMRDAGGSGAKAAIEARYGSGA